MKNMLIVLFLTLVVSICVIGFSQLNNSPDENVEKTNKNPATEIIQ